MQVFDMCDLGSPKIEQKQLKIAKDYIHRKFSKIHEEDTSSLTNTYIGTY